jgi:hypothetical protein
MITNKGKGIIGKYMLGQTPAYASYIAIGCGPTPLLTADPYGDYSAKDNLDFEMFRVPISSRGIINDAGTEKIVFTAELPTEERYEITEIGIFSAGANPSAGAYDSKTVLGFTRTENWQYHTAVAAAIESYDEALDDPEDDNIIAVPDAVFQTNSDNTIFFKQSRNDRYERPRFLNSTILMQGDTADLTIDASTGSSEGHFVIESGSYHIHLTNPKVNFSENSPIDELRLAFALINKDGDDVAVPDTVRVLVEFADTDSSTPNEFARFEAELVNGSGTGSNEYDFETNRYFVISKQLQELYVTSGFTWQDVTVVKIYVSVLVADVPSSDYYIAFDAMRLENIATENPLYGLIGYSVVKNANAETVIKLPNTSNYVEFRFSVGVS